MSAAAERKRERHRTEITEATARMRQLEEELETATRERDQTLIRAHGDTRRGGLSYGDMAEVAGISKGRVIQIVQGRSRFSKQQKTVEVG